mmetsp:Transcript_3476/g.9617  ORF Transcript_3476/g.9617 Transcript_3476/m.9617 type:complete len:396 (-) Transcript_3476:53-1240(-)
MGIPKVLVAPLLLLVWHHETEASPIPRRTWLSSIQSQPFESEWKSVKPKSIVSTLIESGLMMGPNSSRIKRGIAVVKKVTDADNSKLNTVGKSVVLTNFTLGLDASDPLVRVGKMTIYWRSYRNPVLTIEVHDVDINVEFWNHYLTKTNWVQLVAAGFPPSFTSHDDTSAEGLRVESIEVTGETKLRIRSRPLNRQIGILTLDRATLRGLSEEIKRQGQDSLKVTGKRGITMDELSSLLKQYFLKKTHLQVLAELHRIAIDHPEQAAQSGILRAMEKAADVLYDATEKSRAVVSARWKASDLGQKVERSVTQAVGENKGKIAEIKDKAKSRLQSLAQTSVDMTSDAAKKSKRKVGKEVKVMSDELNARVTKILQRHGLLPKLTFLNRWRRNSKKS